MLEESDESDELDELEELDELLELVEEPLIAILESSFESSS